MILDWFFVGFWFTVGAVAASFVITAFALALLSTVAWIDRKRQEREWTELDAGGRIENASQVSFPPREPGPLTRAYERESLRQQMADRGYRLDDRNQGGEN